MNAWKWTLSGVEDGHRGTYPMPVHESGVVRGEILGEALLCLIMSWEALELIDADQPWSLSVEPVAA